MKRVGMVFVSVAIGCASPTFFDEPLHPEWQQRVAERDQEIRRLQLLTHGCHHAYRAERAQERAERVGVPRERRQVLFDRARYHFGLARDHFESAKKLLPKDENNVAYELQGCRSRGRAPQRSCSTNAADGPCTPGK